VPPLVRVKRRPDPEAGAAQEPLHLRDVVDPEIVTLCELLEDPIPAVHDMVHVDRVDAGPRVVDCVGEADQFHGLVDTGPRLPS